MDGLSSARADTLLARMSLVRVLVVGDLMLDRYVDGAVDRVSPEAPVPVVRVESESFSVGGAANVAANAAALGAVCRVVGCVGSDAAGVDLKGALDAMGVLTTGVVVTDDRPTTVKTRVLARRQQVARFDRESDADVSGTVAAEVARAIADLAVECDVLVAEDYNKGVLVPRVIEALRTAAREREIPWIVDPKRRNFFGYEGATVFKPNAKELEDALGTFLHPEDSPWMEGTRERLGCEHLLLTLGDRGMVLAGPGGALDRVPTVARGVYDVSGAGDTVTAVVALALAAGASVAEAALLANHAAAIEVGKAGVSTVSPEELRQHVHDHQA